MTDKKSVYNLALQIVGVSDRISSADEKSLECTVCQDWFAAALDNVLTRYPWRFASKIAPLEPVNRDVPPYRYASKLPVDCLIVRDVFGANARALNHWAMHGMDELMTVEKPVSCLYTQNQDDADLSAMPAYIIELIAARLAVCIAAPLTRSNDLTVKLMQLFNLRLSDAMMADVSGIRDVAAYERELYE